MNIVDMPSKKDQVRSYLLHELNSGKYPPGSRFLSENALFRELGICKNTVREAFSSLVSEGLLERVRGKGTFVLEPYRAPPEGENSAGVVHFICANPMQTGKDDPFIGLLLQGLHTALDPFRWRIYLELFDLNRGMFDCLKTIVANIQPGECAILAGFGFDREVTDLFRDAGIHFLTIGQAEDESVPCVDTDYVSGAFEATEHLIRLGHRRIVLADRRGPHVPSYEKRRKGYMKALCAHDIVPDARLMPEYRGFDQSAGVAVWNELAEYGADYTAILIYGDAVVHGFMKCALEAGREIPRTLSVITFCDYPLPLVNLEVSHVISRFQELGEAAGSMIRNPGLTAGAMQVIPCRLIAGSTVASI